MRALAIVLRHPSAPRFGAKKTRPLGVSRKAKLVSYRVCVAPLKREQVVDGVSRDDSSAGLSIQLVKTASGLHRGSLLLSGLVAARAPATVAGLADFLVELVSAVDDLLGVQVGVVKHANAVLE